MRSSLLLFLLALCTSVFARQSSGKLFFEKVYLHTDRDVYLPGDDIWYKAYLVDAQSGKLAGAPPDKTPLSSNLYVELIDPQATVISRVMLRMDGGLGQGDFKLKDSIPAGTYHIRAYTNWMRNFGDRFIFEKDIRILPVRQPGAIRQASAGITTNVLPAAPAPAVVTVEFFPEGGSLVRGVPSLVAVRAEDGSGSGTPANGEVLDPAGEVIARFSCDSLGMGAFTLWPGAGQYQVRILQNGKIFLFKLPLAETAGFAMSVRSTGQYIHVTATCNETELDRSKGKQLSVVVEHAGRIFFSDSSRLAGTGALFRIPAGGLPEGVASITIYDAVKNPLCERLVYVPGAAGGAALSSAFDKPVYAQGERTELKISLTNARSANLSLSVVDADLVPVQEDGIISYLGLRSEIKGRIEQPRRYFDTTNVNRFKQLDLLLLTQGWRGFVWKNLKGDIITLDHVPEQGITVSGMVRKVSNKDPLPGMNITMYAPKATGQKLFSAISDSAGRFTINGAVFYGYQYLNFTSRNSSMMKADGNSKGFGSGWIRVDSASRDTMAVNPAFKSDNVTRSLPPYIKALVEKEEGRQKFSLTGVNRLGEVVVRAARSRLSTQLPVEVHPITLAEQKAYDNLAQYLLDKIEGAQIASRNCGCGLLPDASFLEQADFPPKPVMISGTNADGSALPKCVCQNDYLTLPMNNVLKVTINRSNSVYGKSVSVKVVLRPGVLEEKNYFDNTVADMTGYYKARVFYVPKTAKPDETDPRGNTIYWEPTITTDNTGTATILFPNKNQKGRVRVVIEGITDGGVPVANSKVYEVK